MKTNGTLFKFCTSVYCREREYRVPLFSQSRKCHQLPAATVPLHLYLSHSRQQLAVLSMKLRHNNQQLNNCCLASARCCMLWSTARTTFVMLFSWSHLWKQLENNSLHTKPTVNHRLEWLLFDVIVVLPGRPVLHWDCAGVLQISKHDARTVNCCESLPHQVWSTRT